MGAPGGGPGAPLTIHPYTHDYFIPDSLGPSERHLAKVGGATTAEDGGTHDSGKTTEDQARRTRNNGGRRRRPVARPDEAERKRKRHGRDHGAVQSPVKHWNRPKTAGGAFPELVSLHVTQRPQESTGRHFHERIPGTRLKSKRRH